MPIDLNHINISLDQFNAAASGKYNIGQLKVGSDGASVVRTNNHKTFTVFNNTRIAPEESLAVKDAFCRALRKEGLSAEAIEDIRRRLGLGDGVVAALAAGNVQPLSAAEVRDILDGCAGQINAVRGSGQPQLRTSAELFRGDSAETIAERQDIRDEINADSVARMENRPASALDRFVDILRADAPRNDWPPATRRIAFEMFRSLGRRNVLNAANADADLALRSAPITLFLTQSGKVNAKCALPGGRTFTVGTGKTRDELFQHVAGILGAPPRRGGKAKAPEPTVPAAPAPRAVPSARDVVASLKKVIAAVTDQRKMDKLKQQALRQLHEEGQDVEFDKKTLALHASAKVRKILTDSVIERLVPALLAVRGNDERIAELANRVRAFVNGDKTVDSKALLDEVEQALGLKKADPAGPKTEDDFDQPLRIDDILGNA